MFPFPLQGEQRGQEQFPSEIVPVPFVLFTSRPGPEVPFTPAPVFSLRKSLALACQVRRLSKAVNEGATGSNTGCKSRDCS
jgi:hypothetical protein